MARVVPNIVGPNRLQPRNECRRGRIVNHRRGHVEAPVPAEECRADTVSPPAGIHAVLAAVLRPLRVPYAFVRRVVGRITGTRA